MNNSKKIIYTYRDGKKVYLEKTPDQFIVRATPERVKEMGFEEVEQVSPSSTRIRTTSTQLESSMNLSRQLAPTHHAYVRQENKEEFLITDRIFVTFIEDITPAEVEAFAGKYALIKRKKYSDRDYLFQLTDHTGMNPVKLVVQLMEEEPLVKIADHDMNRRVKKYDFQLPVDPEYPRQWHLHDHSTDPDFDPRSSSGCEAAWKLLGNYGNPEIVVGITDDGCRMDHSDFDSEAKFVSWGYFQGTRLIVSTDFDARPDKMYEAGANHGTSVAGVIAGEVDATHTVGVAPDCRLLPIKWESDGPQLMINESKFLDALDYVKDKIDILSNSWGSSPLDEWSDLIVRQIRGMAQTGGRRGKGIVFLWAAGNENCPINYTSDIDIPYTDGWALRWDGSWVWVGVRTARVFRHNLVGIPGLMHVAALASTAQRSHYSNYGPGVLITAPSSNGHAYYRDILRGLNITTTTGNPVMVTKEFGGTSSATPLVAGVAALVLSANAALTATEVVSVLTRTASRDLDLTGYPRTEPTSYDPDTSWDVSPVLPFDDGRFHNEGGLGEGSWSPWFGHGRVAALEAVARALQLNGGTAGATSFEATSTPVLSIPDRDPAGVRDVIRCPGSGRLSAIRVSVDIPHTYIGDLLVTLIAPSGKKVILHNRKGGTANDLQETYDAPSLASLSTFFGDNVQGDWTLEVADLAFRDEGHLQKWSLYLEIDSTELIRIGEEPGVVIPDKQPAGTERSLVLNQKGRIKDLEVSIDITHTYIGDLKVTLTAPDGTPVILHNQTGGSADNLIRKYSMNTIVALQVLKGKSFQGIWKLHVADLVAADRGKLNAWELLIVPEG